MAIQACIVGYGLSAKIFHLPFLLSSPAFALHSIVQRTPPASPSAPGQSAPADFPSITHFTSIDDALKDPSIDLFILTSVPSTHYPFTRAALEAGKHVLCEKPFVPTAAEAGALVALAQQKRKVLAVYQNRRWDADFLTLQKLVADGTLGRIVELETHFDRHRPAVPTATTWKANPDAPAGGCIYDLGTHLLDQMVALFGKPSSVDGIVGDQRLYPAGQTAGAGGDSFTVQLRWDSQPGLLVTAKAGIVSPLPRQTRFLVKGEKAAWKKEGMDAQEAQLHAGVRPSTYAGPKIFEGPGAQRGYGEEEPSYHGTLYVAAGTSGVSEETTTPVVQTYVEFYRLLGEAIQNGGQAPVTAEEAQTTLQVIEAAVESSKTGRTVRL